MNELLFALKQCDEFINFNEKELNKLLSISDVEVFNKGEEVFTIDHEGRKFYIVVDGRLTLRLKSSVTKEYKRGKLFGEVAILGDTLRFGTIRATEQSRLLSFDRDIIFNSDKISKELALKITLSLTKKIISYFEVESFKPTEESISKGECDYIEFKKSINNHNKAVIVKTLAGFMNLNGGTVFCGVNDNGEIVGFDVNAKEFDEIQKQINKEINTRLGSSFRHYVLFDIEKIRGKKVIRIDCNSSKSPVFYKEFDINGHEREYFVVRSGSENRKMKKTSEVINYVQERFKNR